MFTLHLVGISVELVDAWKQSFSSYAEVEVLEANILDVASDTVVSPANSYGDMGGGIDLAYRKFFGRSIERSVQEQIEKGFSDYLPIGEAVLVNTGHEKIPRLIAAPTMFLPGPTDEENVCRAMTAALRLAQQQGDTIKDLYCPGLGTGVGRVDVSTAAQAMQAAYSAMIGA